MIRGAWRGEPGAARPSPRRGRGLRTFLTQGALVCAAAWSAGAQTSGEARSIAGRVTRPGEAADRPVVGEWVTLHRVGPDAAGPIDSMRTGPDGRYAFRYRATGDTTAVYFVSTNRGGVNYFTPPVRERVVRDGVAELMVYDTTSAPVPIAVRGRHVIVTAADTGSPRRMVLEAYEVSNDSSVTRVAGADGFTFEAPLPPGVDAVAPGQGDVSEDAIRLVDGRVRITAPLSPGLRRFSFSYTVPVDAPLELLVETPVPVLEVLVEDARATATGAGLAVTDPVEIEGRPFKRFLAEDVAAAQTMRVVVPADPAGRDRRVTAVVVAVAIALAAGLLVGLGPMVRRRAGRGTTPPDEAARLALEVAALDERFAALQAPSDEERAVHAMTRARLTARLAALLAKPDGAA